MNKHEERKRNFLDFGEYATREESRRSTLIAVGAVVVFLVIIGICKLF